MHPDADKGMSNKKRIKPFVPRTEKQIRLEKAHKPCGLSFSEMMKEFK